VPGASPRHPSGHLACNKTHKTGSPGSKVARVHFIRTTSPLPHPKSVAAQSGKPARFPCGAANPCSPPGGFPKTAHVTRPGLAPRSRAVQNRVV